MNSVQRLCIAFHFNWHILSDFFLFSIVIDAKHSTLTIGISSFIIIMSDFRVVTRFTQQIDLRKTQLVALGNVGQKSPNVPAGTNYDFLMTVPTIHGICNRTLSWNQEIINTYALLMHMKVRSIGLREIDVIPFTMQAIDYQTIYEYRLDQVILQACATKVAMIMYFPTDEGGFEGHYAFVEFDSKMKMVIVCDAHDRTITKKGIFMENNDPHSFMCI